MLIVGALIAVNQEHLGTFAIDDVGEGAHDWRVWHHSLVSDRTRQTVM